VGSSLACTICKHPYFGMILNAGGPAGPVVGARLPLEPNKITKPSAARVVSPVHPRQERIPLALKAEHVTVPASASVTAEMKCRTL
jgi:hypothetical protein